MPFNDNVKQLYDALKADGHEVGTEKQFLDYLQAPGEQGYKNRKRLYDFVKSEGANIGNTYAEFSSFIGLHTAPKKPQPVQSEAVGTQANEPTSYAPKPEESKAQDVGMQAEDTPTSKQWFNLDNNQQKDSTRLGLNTTPKLQLTGEAPQTGSDLSDDLGAARGASLGGRVMGDLLRESRDKELAGDNVEAQEMLQNLREQERLSQTPTIGDIYNQIANAQESLESHFDWKGNYDGRQFQNTPSDIALNEQTRATRRLLADAKKSLELGQQERDDTDTFGSGLLSFGKSAARELLNPANYMFGLLGAENAVAIEAAADAVESGTATPAQEELLNAATMKMIADGYKAVNAGRGMKAGEVTGEMLPFIVEMMINPIAATGKSAAKKVAQNVLKRFGSQIAKGGVRRLAAKGAAETAGLATRFALSIPQGMGMAVTTGLPATIGDFYTRRMGDITPEYEEGQAVYGGRENREDTGEAILDALLAQTYERSTEISGSVLTAPAAAVVKGLLGATARGAGKLASSGLNKVGLGNVVDWMSHAKPTRFMKALSDLEKRAQWQGTINEYFEEIDNNILNALTVGDMNFGTGENGVFNLDTNIDTFLGVAALGGAVSLTKTGAWSWRAVRGQTYQAKKDLKDAESVCLSQFGADWQVMKNLVDGSTADELARTIGSLAWDKDKSERILTPEQFHSLLSYASASTKLDAMQATIRAHNTDNPVSNAIHAAADEGYNAPIEDYFGLAQQYLSAQDNAQAVFGEQLTNLMQQYEASSDDEWNQIMSGMSSEEASVLDNLIESQARIDGALDAARDRADDATRTLETAVRVASYEVTSADGQKRTEFNSAKLGGREVYVIGRTGSMAVVIDPNTLERETVAVSSLSDWAYNNSEDFINQIRQTAQNASLTDADNAFSKHPKTQEPARGLVIKQRNPDGTESAGIISGQDADGNWIVQPAKMNEQGEWVPQNTDAPIVMTSENVIEAQNNYYSGAVEQEEAAASPQQSGQEGAMPQQSGQERAAAGGATGSEAGEQPSADGVIINDGKGGADDLGNTLNSDGSVYAEPVSSLDEITDADFDTPSRSVELPALPQNVANAIGTQGKPVIIKKNIFEKNAEAHVELDAADSRQILSDALYNPNLVGQTQPVKRPDYKVAVHTGDKNSVVVLDVFQGKKQVEIVGWRRVDAKGLEKMKRQAEREGGQFLILSPGNGSAAALSALPQGLSSEGKGTNVGGNDQGNSVNINELLGNGGFLQVEPEVTGQYLFDEEQSGLDSNEAEEFVKLRAVEARKNADKLARKKPKMQTDLNKYKQEKANWSAQVQQAEAEVAYWQNVQEWRKNSTGENLLSPSLQMTPALQQAIEDLKGDKGAMEILSNAEPQNLEEIAADMLKQPGGVRLLRNDEEVNGVVQKGALSHSGFHQSDVKRFPFLFASSAKGGMSFDRAGEEVLQRARDARIPYDENDANAGVNAILNVLHSVEKQSDLNNYIQNNRISMAYAYHDELERQREAFEEEERLRQEAEERGMTPQEYDAWVSSHEERMALQEEYENSQAYYAAVEEYLTNFAPEQKAKDNDTEIENADGRGVTQGVSQSEGQDADASAGTRTSDGRTPSDSGRGELAPGRGSEQQIAGLEGYTEQDVEAFVRQHIEDVLGDEAPEIVGVKVIGSRTNGTATDESDLDVLVEYKGNAREDDLFNALNDEENRLFIDGVPVDINPITQGKSGTIAQFLERNAGYQKESEQPNAEEQEETPPTPESIKERASRFPNETTEEAVDFDQKIPDMSDEELLAYMREDGNGDANKSYHMNLYDEFDFRHTDEELSAYDSYSQWLADNEPTREQAEDMLADVLADTSGLTSEERPLLLGQMNALQEYIDARYAEEENLGSSVSEPVEVYRSKDGSAIAYQSLLFDSKTGQPTQDNTQKQAAQTPTDIRLRPLKKGEICKVERRYEENKMFDFTGKEKIESIDDVAYIFKQLENAAVENSFIVFVKDGRPTVLHLAIGTYSSVDAPIGNALVAFQNLKPDKVYFVHNHPSGSLRSSSEDRRLMLKFREAFGSKHVEPGIIIDTTSGYYGLIDVNGGSDKSGIMPDEQENTTPLKVYNFSKQVFAPDWNPELAFTAANSVLVAEFISSHRLGEREKMSMLILNHQNQIVGNVFLPWTSMSDIMDKTASGKQGVSVLDNMYAAADLLASYIHQMGGISGMLYGSTSLDKKVIGFLSSSMKRHSVRLMDVLRMLPEGDYSSASERGYLSESEPEKYMVSEPTVIKGEKTSDDDMPIGGKYLSLPTDQDKAIISEQRASMPPTAQWRDGVGDIVVHTVLAIIRKRYADLHARAKAGDTAAAVDLVLSVAKEEKVAALAEQHPNAVVAYVRAEEATGTNKIPNAYAALFESHGLPLSDIVQTNKPAHTGSDRLGRFVRRARFDGEVEPGREYILVDDHATMGGTLRDLKDYIESKGGKVVAVSTLTASAGGTKLQPTPEQLELLQQKGITNEQLKELGIADDITGLTRSEARELLVLADSRGGTSPTPRREARRGAVPQTVEGAQGQAGLESPGNVQQQKVIDPKSQQLFDAAKNLFGTTNDLREAGYILPDGSMLDFTGAHTRPGMDSSFLRGARAIDHREISSIAYEQDGETETGLETDMSDFINRGAIRIDGNSGSINLAVKPTDAQRAVLRRLVARKAGDVWVDFGDGWDNDHYAEYEGALSARVLADIDRYFDEGIKPIGDVVMGEVSYRKVTDKEKIARLDNAPTIKVYRAMQIIDGKLYPPMSAKTEGRLREPSELGVWEEAEERPDLADDKGYFKLDKGNKKGLKARYNPYFHTSATMLNDQFSEAQSRGNLVVVETEVPASELASGYKAEKAKDSVGRVEWKAGIIQGQLSGTREVVLSRWAKPVRIVPVEEVADHIADMVLGTGIVMPSNVVTPKQRAALEIQGVPFVKTDNQGTILEGENAGKKYGSVYKAKDGRKKLNGESVVGAALREQEERLAKTKEQITSITSRYGMKDSKDVVVVTRETDLNTLKGRVSDKSLSEIKEKFRSANTVAVFDHRSKTIVIFANKMQNNTDAEVTWMHEKTHAFMAGLPKAERERFQRACLDWLQKNAPDFYDKLTEEYEEREWLGEAAPQVVEYLCNEYGIEKFLGAKVGGNEIMSNFAQQLQYYFIHGTEEGTDNDRLRSPEAGEQGNASVAETQVVEGLSDRRVRERSGLAPLKDAVQNEYERQMQRTATRLIEITQDNAQSVLEGIRAIEKGTAKKVRDYENPYFAKNRGESIARIERDLYHENEQKRLEEAVGRIQQNKQKEKRKTIDQINRYVIDKHGLERNRVLAFRDAIDKIRKAYEAATGNSANEIYDGYKNDPARANNERQLQQARRDFLAGNIDLAAYQKAYDHYVLMDDMLRASHLNKAGDALPIRTKAGNLYYKYRQEDYSGLPKPDVASTLAETEAEAFKRAALFEQQAFDGADDAEGFWDAVRGVSDYGLKHNYNSGLISKDMYDYVRGMFDYYVPLRGWSATTNSDLYVYSHGAGRSDNSMLKRAEGRTTEADRPLSTLAAMSDMAISAGNRNLANQTLLRLAENHPSALLSVSKLWFVKNDVTGDYEVADYVNGAGIRDNDDADTIRAKYEAFEERMRQLQAKEPEKYVRSGERPDVPNMVKSQHLGEHQVVVKRGGVDYVVTVNGNPRMAQALNGKLVDSSDSFMRKVSRGISALLTGLNPYFTLPNLMRDWGFASEFSDAREGSKEVNRIAKMVPVSAARMPLLLRRFNAGSLDMSKKYDRLFHEFMMNGGETGRSAAWSIDEYHYALKHAGERRYTPLSWIRFAKAIPNAVEAFSRWSELSTRFAAFVVSKDMGRSTARAIYDAKQVSANFDKRGSGRALLDKEKDGKLLTAWGSFIHYGQGFIPFFNAATQGFASFLDSYVGGYDRVKGSRARWLNKVCDLFAMGLIWPFFHAFGYALKELLAGDDDDDKTMADKMDKLTQEGLENYFSHPQWDRQLTLIFGPFKMPLTPEIRAVYAPGEIITETLWRKQTGRYVDDAEVVRRIAESLGEILPANFVEGGRGLVPVPIAALYDVRGNEDWKGSAIYKDVVWYSKNKTAQYERAFTGSYPVLVKATKWLNDATRKYTEKTGWADLNPAAMGYYLRQNLGGAYAVPNDIATIIAAVMNGEKVSIRNYPIVSRFLSFTGEYKDTDIKKEYNANQKMMEEFVARIDEEVQAGNTEAEKRLRDSDLAEWYDTIWKPYASEITKAHKEKDSELELELKEEVNILLRDRRKQEGK